MNEIAWLDELYTVCSPSSMDILKFLWSQGGPVDTHSISKGIHMSMEEVYQYLQSLETQGLVKMKRIKTKNGSRRYWTTTLDKFAILIKAEKGDFTYRSNIGQKSSKIGDIITEKTSKKKLKAIQEISALPTTKIKVMHKQGNIELEGSESFVEKRWSELKPFVKHVATTTKKSLSAKKQIAPRKIKTKTKRSKIKSQAFS